MFSFALSHLACAVLFTDPVPSGHENGNFLFTSGSGGIGPSILVSVAHQKTCQEFFQRWRITCYYYLVVVLGFLCCTFITKPQEELGILCAVTWSVKPTASSLPWEAADRNPFKWTIKWCCCQTRQWLLGALSDNQGVRGNHNLWDCLVGGHWLLCTPFSCQDQSRNSLECVDSSCKHL